MLRIDIKSMVYPNGYKALENISSEFKDRGMYFILGDSGCGKSTLLRCLSGMENFDGRLVYDDKEIDDKIKNEFMRNNVGFIFQDYRLFDGMSTYDNVAVAGEIAGIKADKQKITDILAEVGLDKYIDTKVRLLSGGERQRVAIARALAKDSKIIVADEPTGNLDKKNSKNIMNILKELSDKKLVIVVTHDKKLADEYADTIIHMVDGKISQTEQKAIGDLDNKHNKVDKKDNNPQKNKLSISEFLRLAFLKNSGSKIISTSILCVILFLLAIVTTMVAGQNKYKLTDRYLRNSQGNFAQVIYYSDDDMAMSSVIDGTGDYSAYIKCNGWQIKQAQKYTSDSFWASDDNIGKIDYCIRLGNLDCGIKILSGNLPTSSNEIAIPVTIAQTLDLENKTHIIGQTITVNTGIIDKEFVVSGIYDAGLPQIPQKYQDISYAEVQNYNQSEREKLQTILEKRNQSILNRSIVVWQNTLNDMLDYSTAEQYNTPLFKCKKDSKEIVIINAQKIGIELQEGEVLLSPILDSMLKLTSANEYNKGILTFDIETQQKNNSVNLQIKGIEYSLADNMAIVLSQEDYYNIISQSQMLYDAYVINYSEYSTREMYNLFEKIYPDMKCYITSNYEYNEHISTIQLVENYSKKIILPIAIFLWILCILCVYILTKNILIAGKKNLAIMRVLGIEKNAYFAMSFINNLCYVLIAGIIAFILALIISIIVGQFGFFVPSIIAFSGWEFLGFFISSIIGILCAFCIVTTKLFKASIEELYRKNS